MPTFPGFNHFVIDISSITTLDTIKITGDFWVGSHHVLITDESLVSGGITMAGNVICGFGKAILIEPNSVAIGAR